jgi:hypothetical protein
MAIKRLPYRKPFCFVTAPSYCGPATQLIRLPRQHENPRLLLADVV